MRTKFKAMLPIAEHQQKYEEFVTIIEDICGGKIFELELSDDLEQLFELQFSTRQDAVTCKQKLTEEFPTIELSEITNA